MDRSRVLFCLPDQGVLSVRGGLVQKMQQALSDKGKRPGSIDGIFGRKTRDALAAWQSDKGREPSGWADLITWKELTGEEEPPLRERALQLTASFEGHGFTKICGNFDGAGLTWGIIGFTLKHGEIAKMLNELGENRPELLEKAFGPLLPALMGILSKPARERIGWADGISVGSSRQKVRPEWERAFAALGAEPAVQALQISHVEGYFHRAEKDAKNLGLASEPGFALCFDIAVQNGRIDEEEKGRIQEAVNERPPETERELLKIIAVTVAENSRPRYVEDVKARKLTIAEGSGRVHGARYQVHTWGIA